MPDYRSIARREAESAGLDPNVFVRQIGAESGFNPNARSPAGAVGIAQIMPATAKGWGVDPSDPVASLRAAAKNMASYVRRYGSYENALRAYNAGPGNIAASRGFSETNRYVSNILGGHEPSRMSTPARTSTDAPTTAGDQSSGQQLAALLLANQPEKQQPRPSMGLATPAFAAAPAMPVGAQQVASGGGQQGSPGAALSAALTAVRGLQGTDAPARDIAPAAEPGDDGGSTGSVKITGPNPGRIKPHVLQFARRISSILGEPIVGSDGSGHSYLTVNGNVSQHSTGNATDVPATGADLIRKGRAALIAAGMPAAQARKQKGGLYNVNGHQIIFNTHEGGDHTGHLHISAR